MRINSSRSHFFKVFLPELSSHRLEISPAFRKHLKGKASTTVFLTGPSGNTWKVELLKREGHLFFDKGWRAFATDHSLQLGEFLVFEYDGTSRFSVLVFDVTACEKETTFFAKPQHGRKGSKGKSVKEEADVCDDYDPDEDENEMEKEVKEKKKRERPASPSDGDGGGVEITYWKKKRNVVGFGKRGKHMLASQRRQAREEEIKRAHAAACSFMSKNPFFMVVLSKTMGLGYFLRIPGYFGKVHLSYVRRMIIRRTCGGVWNVYLRCSNNRIYIGAGWHDFSVDNGLEEDDACVFELVKKKEMVVHIFRVEES